MRNTERIRELQEERDGCLAQYREDSKALKEALLGHGAAADGDRHSVCAVIMARMKANNDRAQEITAEIQELTGGSYDPCM